MKFFARSTFPVKAQPLVTITTKLPLHAEQSYHRFWCQANMAKNLQASWGVYWL